MGDHDSYSDSPERLHHTLSLEDFLSLAFRSKKFSS